MAFVKPHNSVVTGGTSSYENNPSFGDPRDGSRKFRKVGSKHFNPEGGGQHVPLKGCNVPIRLQGVAPQTTYTPL